MRSFGALLLIWGFSMLSVAVVQGQEAGEDAQEATAFEQDEVGNDSDDIAVGGVWVSDTLFIIATTETVLEDSSAGGIDFVIKSFDSDLEGDTFTQEGGDGDDVVTAITVNEVNLDLVIVGSTISTEVHLFDLDTPTGEMDWFIATLDRTSLEVESSYVNGTTDNDQRATAVVATEDGDFIVAGYTWGTYFEENAGADNDDDSVGYDAWVLKIGADLDPELLWSVQFGTIAYDEPSAMVIDDNGDVYVVGTTTDSASIVSAADEEEIQSMFVYKLDGSTGDEIWAVTTELGVLSDASQAHGAVLNEDQTELYVSGNTQGIIPDFEGDTTGTDELFVLGLDVDDGTTNWVYQSESNATAFGTGGVVLADDGVSPIIGGIAFGNQFDLPLEYWESGSGDMIAAMIDIDDLEVVMYYNAAAASNQTREDALAMIKDPDVTDGVYLIGQEDGDYADEEVEPEDTLNYLLLKVELDEIPEEEDDDEDDDDKPYPYIQTAAIFVGGGIAFYGAYKWAAYSKVSSAKKATMI